MNFWKPCKIKTQYLIIASGTVKLLVSKPFLFTSMSLWASDKHSVASILSSTPVQYIAGHEKTVGPVANPITVQDRTQHSH